MSTLDNLRKTAKRWLRALRAGDPEARARLQRAHPSAPATPVLRDVQHALAREHGHENWTALTQHLSRHESGDERQVAIPAPTETDEVVATFIEQACWDHHTHGVSSYRSNLSTAMRMLARHPAITQHDFYTAIVCGDLEEVERMLRAEPSLATRKGGPRGWEPLLYLCYSRLPLAALDENALAIARALLDRGADPNAYYMAGDSRYTALVGVAGEGEQDAPRDAPYKSAMYQLLLERGAGPYDIQVLYNTHFSGDMLWWLELTYAHDVRRGDVSAWKDPSWAMLGMGGYGPGAYFVLRIAVGKNDLTLAEWALTHGADPNVMTSSHPKFKPRRTHYQEAMLRGSNEMVELLLRHGARPDVIPLVGEEAFVAACLRMDREEVRAILSDHPEYLHSPKAAFAAAELDRADVVAWLLDLGVPLEIEDEHRQRILHVAAGNGALKVAKLLIERGAEIDPRETRWNATPIGHASYGDRREMIDLLTPVSRNVWTFTWLGNVDRVRQVLAAEPERATEISAGGGTPLMWLPDDEEKAIELVRLFLAHGTDPTVRTTEDGMTAAQYARKRGLDRAADVLDAAATAAAPPSATPVDPARLAHVSTRGEDPLATAASPTVALYESLARDLVVAFESGEAEALRRLNEYFGATVTWDRLREGVRQRLGTVPQSEQPAGYFALPHARLVLARHAGAANWSALVSLLESGRLSSPGDRTTVAAPDLGPGMIQPVELKAGFRVRFRDGAYGTTTEVWDMLIASRNGALTRVKELVALNPALVLCDHNYMSPLHLAVRENHPDVVQYLCEQGAANPSYVTYPYREKLPVIARDRGYEDIARLVEEHYRRADPNRPEDEGVEVEYVKDEGRHRFQQLVNSNAHTEVEAMLARRPELALDELASWGEGILSMPANRGNRQMLELLMHHGARVPVVCKWGPEYYFKRYEIAAFLVDRGMSVHQMNHHHTTLLHHMAYIGDRQKATLLLDRGADINAVDEEFQSTPLGFAARFGRREMVELLLERGADPDKSVASWAAPTAWARTKGHGDIEALLRRAGAGRSGMRQSTAARDKQVFDVVTEMNRAVERRDVTTLDRLIREHRGLLEEHAPDWLAVDAATTIARAHTERKLPVRPDIKEIEREVEREGGNDAAARLSVARRYGADSWERLVLACRLIEAIWRDEVDVVREIVTRHPHLLHEEALIRDSNWGPPLTYAANLGRNRIIKLLYELGAKDLKWAMGRAILQGQVDTARMLYGMGARVPQLDAVFSGPAESLNGQGMSLLLDLGAALTPENAPTALVLETYSRNPSGKHRILELFARHGVLLPDTPPLAVHRGRIDLLEAHLRNDPHLLSRTFSDQEIYPPALGCHGDGTPPLYGTPLAGAGLLHMCVDYDEIEIARWMIERGADVNLEARLDAAGFGGHTPLFNAVVSYAALCGRQRDGAFARLLLDHGADPAVRASLRIVADDESLRECRNVTPLEWGEQFPRRDAVNTTVMQMLRERRG